jgi:hypothetical protein
MPKAQRLYASVLPLVYYGLLMFSQTTINASLEQPLRVLAPRLLRLQQVLLEVACRSWAVSTWPDTISLWYVQI